MTEAPIPARKSLVTGAGGFVGANLVRRLAESGCPTVAVIRPGANRWRLEGIPGLEILELDLWDGAAVAEAVNAVRPDWIFHLAAHGAYSHQIDVDAIVRTNVGGTVNLLQACLTTGFEAFVNTGSSSEYGFKDHAPAEDEHLEPNSHYAWTKAAATHYCRHTATATGKRVPTLRLYSVYGPYEEPGRLIPALVARGLDGRFPPLVDPSISRDFVYVDDVCDAYLAAATGPIGEPGAVYNVGTGIQTTLARAVEVTRQRLSIGAEPQWGGMAARDWDTTTWVARPDKIRAELGWRPQHTFEQGLDRFVGWFQAHPELHYRYESRPTG